MPRGLPTLERPFMREDTGVPVSRREICVWISRDWRSSDVVCFTFWAYAFSLPLSSRSWAFSLYSGGIMARVFSSCCPFLVMVDTLHEQLSILFQTWSFFSFPLSPSHPHILLYRLHVLLNSLFYFIRLIISYRGLSSWVAFVLFLRCPILSMSYSPRSSCTSLSLLPRSYKNFPLTDRSLTSHLTSSSYILGVTGLVS